MERNEFVHLIGAVIILTAVISFSAFLAGQYSFLSTALLFSIVLIAVHVGGKKLMANMLDCDVEHRLWTLSQYGYKPQQHFKKPMPASVVIPFGISIITGGIVKCMAILTYEAKAKTIRAAKRFGFYSFTELTDWHNAVIGAGGIIALLTLSAVSYFLPAQLEQLAGLAAGYAFWNMLPISDLDGTQIFFGSRILYATLGVITLIFSVYSLHFWLI